MTAKATCFLEPNSAYTDILPQPVQPIATTETYRLSKDANRQNPNPGLLFINPYFSQNPYL